MKNVFLRMYLIFFGLFLFLYSPLSAQHHHKNCGTDHATEILKQRFPDQAHQWEDFHERVIPALVASAPSDQRSAAPVLRVPVVIHIIHNGEAIGSGANISAAQVQAQLDILNEDFAAQNANFNQTPSQWTNAIGSPDIQFCLATVDPSGNPSNGITRHQFTITGTNTSDSNIEDEIKPATAWDSNLYYNIWTLAIPGTSANGGTVGYAYLPNQFTIGSDFDGTVVDWRWFGGPGFSQSGYKTLTHETGHYLGLPHTFNDTDCGGDDNIEDTPNISAATASLIPSLSCSNNNFPTGPSSCGNEHMYVNYMDYVNSDYCYTSFTEGQIAVMRGVLEGTRPFNYGSRLSLVNNNSVACSAAANNIGITQVTAPATGTTCQNGVITPTVTVGNFGTEAITTFSVSYQINNNPVNTSNFVDNVPSGSTVTVTLPAYTPPNGNYTFSVFTSNPNGTNDDDTSNDTTSFSTEVVTPRVLPFTEDFTNINVNPTPQGSYVFNPDSDNFAWEHHPVSANGTTGGSILFDNYAGDNANNPFGTIDAFITPIFDLSNSTGTSLNFDVAYARYFGNNQYFNDSLRILVSVDCGNSYNQLVFNEGGEILETGTASSNPFTPTPGEWDSRTINLNNYDGQSAVSLAFVNISGWGNRIFVDNINLAAASTPTCDLSSSVSTGNPGCFQDQDGFAEANPENGTAPYSYNWSNGASTKMINNLSAGTYTVTVTDQENCSTIASATITDPAEIMLSISTSGETAPGAEDGTATAAVTGGTGNYTYQWSNASTDNPATNLAPGDYTITIYDERQCSQTAAFTILAATIDCSNLTATLTPRATSCHDTNDGQVLSTTSGGQAPYNYNWSNGRTTKDINTLTPGNYRMTVTDQFGCTATKNTNVTAPQELSGTFSTTNNEPGSAPPRGAATVTMTGGTANYSYQWSTGATTASIQNMEAGDYSLTVSDQNQCTWNGQVTIENEPIDCSSLQATIIAENIQCNGNQNGTASVQTTGGTPEYFYTWSNGATTAAIQNLTPGNYSVTIVDVNGCSTTASALISEPDILTANLSGQSDPCNTPGGTLNVSPTGGNGNYQVSWSNGATGTTTSITQSGMYQVTVTDANGCSDIQEMELSVSSSVMELTIDKNNTNCAFTANGAATANVNGGTAPYTYLWNTGSTMMTIENLAASTYSVVVTDAMGCEREQIFTMTEPAPISLSCSGTAASNGNDGFAEVSSSGGTGPYTYNWSNGASGSFVQGLTNGTYTVTVTDRNDCTEICEVDLLSTSINITENITDLKIFPNPAEDWLYIQASLLENEVVQLRLYNLVGQAVWEEQFQNRQIEAAVDLAQLSAGTYLLKLETKAGAVVRKVIIL